MVNDLLARSGEDYGIITRGDFRGRYIDGLRPATFTYDERVIWDFTIFPHRSAWEASIELVGSRDIVEAQLQDMGVEWRDGPSLTEQCYFAQGLVLRDEITPAIDSWDGGRAELTRLLSSNLRNPNAGVPFSVRTSVTVVALEAFISERLGSASRSLTQDIEVLAEEGWALTLIPDTFSIGEGLSGGSFRASSSEEIEAILAAVRIPDRERRDIRYMRRLQRRRKEVSRGVRSLYLGTPTTGFLVAVWPLGTQLTVAPAETRPWAEFDSLRNHYG